jgi:RNA polymerase sigma-70 factor (ECF subfamily)
MGFFNGLTHREIAERLGEPLGTVKSRIKMGMDKLKDSLRSFEES